MEMRYPYHPDQYKRMTTAELRANFHIGNLFTPDELRLVYSHVDRVIIGGVMPTDASVELTADKHDLGTDYFLDRREVGIINIGGEGSVTVDGQDYAMAKRDSLYVGKGVRQVVFNSTDKNSPAQFFIFSAPAHTVYPTTHLKIQDAAPVQLGDPLNSNKRTIYKYIHPEGVKSCQIVMGMTLLEPGSMWNTMPAHSHARRMEAYLYFDIGADNVVFHLVGEPEETRHVVMRDREAVISPSWSIHSGMGTGSYTFVWAMAGENQTFTDMDAVPMKSLL
jgi:4-deoxy-L-threo-5-hexosulose-uronate ketol-isomerase